MPPTRVAPIDYAVLAIYFAFVLGIGWFLRKNVSSSSDFLTSGHSLPLWITSLAFLAANMGALEMIGMCGSGAKYGMMTSHFYWIGAIPAMLFVGVFMMPFYYGSKARSVPEYLKLRYDEKTRYPCDIHLKDQRPFVMAGVYEHATKLRPATFAILTTRPNALMEKIHERMPAILERRRR